MPVISPHPSAWLWGVYFGLFIGGGVVVVSGLKYGFSLALLLLGLVLALVFAIAGVLAGVVRRYTPGGPT